MRVIKRTSEVHFGSTPSVNQSSIDLLGERLSIGFISNTLLYRCGFGCVEANWQKSYGLTQFRLSFQTCSLSGNVLGRFIPPYYKCMHPTNNSNYLFFSAKLYLAFLKYAQPVENTLLFVFSAAKSKRKTQQMFVFLRIFNCMNQSVVPCGSGVNKYVIIHPVCLGK